MRVTFDVRNTNVIVRSNADRTIRFRSPAGVTMTVDGTDIEPTDKGHSDVDLDAGQSAYWRKLVADPAALLEIVETGFVDLPETRQQGRALATGPTLAQLAADALQAAAATEPEQATEPTSKSSRKSS
jgi:hypothetical protein